MRGILRFRDSLTKYEKALVLLFVLSTPFVNPWVRGDGVGYYAYVRSLLVEGDLRFDRDWLSGNSSFVMPKVDAKGHLLPALYTSTGHIDNHFAIGPAILWAPFLGVVHLVAATIHRSGAGIAADGFSWPYMVTMALATASYGFVGLFLAFKLARVYFDERWAFWGTLGIWLASSLPVYMYLNPSWSHAHSAFAVSLFLWYWHRTRGSRTNPQWALLGVLSGLMLNVYYMNAVFLLIPLVESLGGYWRTLRSRPPNRANLRLLFAGNLLYAVVVVLAFLPTLITRYIIYGSPFATGYPSLGGWSWGAPVLGEVLFSPNHGLFTWTPILVPAVFGLLWLGRYDREFAGTLLGCFFVFFYVIASYPTWHGISSFGNRFFVSLTPVFVLGLSASFAALEKLARPKWVSFGVPAGVALLIMWNLGFIFQWGTKMIPNRGPILWREMVHNQVAVVPTKLLVTTKSYLQGRRALMESLEREDVRQLQSQTASKESEQK